MTAIPPNPEPDRTPGLEPGGGVPPGSTPPAAAQTSAGAEPQPSTHGRLTPTAVATVIAVVVFFVLFLSVAVVLIMKIFGGTG
jgi:hypothetical protein